MHPVFGTDIGGVLAPTVPKEYKGQFSLQDLRNFYPIKDSFRVLARLAKNVFEPQFTFVVSYCDEATEIVSRRWLMLHGFFEITGIPSTNLFYCRKRSDKQIICEELEISTFVDDNIKVINSIQSVQNRYLFRTKNRTPINVGDPTIKIVQSWLDIEREHF